MYAFFLTYHVRHCCFLLLNTLLYQFELWHYGGIQRSCDETGGESILDGEATNQIESSQK